MTHRVSRLRAAVVALALALGAGAADQGKPPKTAADIKWPTPSQKPGTVKVVSRYPTEGAWNPVLDRFRKDVGQAEFDRRLAVAAGFPAKRAKPPAFRSGTPTPAAAATVAVPELLRAVDIVRVPLLSGDKLDVVLAKLSGQLTTLAADGYTTAVWEVTELPAPGKDMQEWADKCFAAFPRPPVLMLGWHVAKGKLQPGREAMGAFLRTYGNRCHSIMLTGEELNTQYYGPVDGGRALDFLACWLGFIREVSPEAFVWARIDEVLKRPNDRNQAWIARLYPVVDGVCYQAAHDALLPGYELGLQVDRLRRDIRRAVPPAAGAAATAPPPLPLLVGGFMDFHETDPDHPVPEAIRTLEATAQIPRYEQWLRDHQVCGYVRFIGYPPERLYPYLIGRELAAGPTAGEAPK